MTLSAKTKTRIAKLFNDNNYPELFVNKKGEIFTQEHLARLSVSGNKKDYRKVTRSEVESWDKKISRSGKNNADTGADNKNTDTGAKAPDATSGDKTPGSENK